MKPRLLRVVSVVCASAILNGCASVASNETNANNAAFLKDMSKGKSAEHMGLLPFDDPNYAKAAFWYQKAVQDAQDSGSAREAEQALQNAQLMAQAQANYPPDYAGAIAEGATNSFQQLAATRNGGQGYVPPPPHVPAYARQQTVASGGFSYDQNLGRCVTLGADGQSVYFQNRCDASLTIAFYQAAGAGMGQMDCGPGGHCVFGAFGIGYSGRNNTIYAVYPQGDSAVLPDGNQWQGQGAFRCRRP